MLAAVSVSVFSLRRTSRSCAKAGGLPLQILNLIIPELRSIPTVAAEISLMRYLPSTREPKLI
jgi:hypothetical protein